MRINFEDGTWYTPKGIVHPCYAKNEDPSTVYLSKIDLKQAYHQILLEESSNEVTAFAIPGKGLFQFTRFPYELTNAPASFQRAMDNIFGPEWQPQVFVYRLYIKFLTLYLEPLMRRSTK